jgi:hypothetical protein
MGSSTGRVRQESGAEGGNLPDRQQGWRNDQLKFRNTDTHTQSLSLSLCLSLSVSVSLFPSLKGTRGYVCCSVMGWWSGFERGLKPGERSGTGGVSGFFLGGERGSTTAGSSLSGRPRANLGAVQPPTVDRKSKSRFLRTVVCQVLYYTVLYCAVQYCNLPLAPQAVVQARGADPHRTAPS